MFLEFFAENVGILVILLSAYVAGTIAAFIFYAYDKYREKRTVKELLNIYMSCVEGFL